jgi:hypothetical protein
VFETGRGFALGEGADVPGAVATLNARAGAAGSVSRVQVLRHGSGEPRRLGIVFSLLGLVGLLFLSWERGGKTVLVFFCKLSWVLSVLKPVGRVLGRLRYGLAPVSWGYGMAQGC